MYKQNTFSFPKVIAGFLAGLLLLAQFFTGSAKADQTDVAAKFVQGLGDKAIATLADKSVSPEQAAKIFRAMLESSFDLDLIGRFALGPAVWKESTSTQRQEYLKHFEKLVIQIYSDRFKLYSGETFKVTSAKAEDDRDTYVTGVIQHANGAPPTQVDWRIRNKGAPKVIDVIVEGVSMSVTQRSEFSAIIQKNGGNIDALLKTLAERVAHVQ